MSEDASNQSSAKWVSEIEPYHRNPYGKPLAAQTAIIVIDAQNYFLNEEFAAFMKRGKAIIPNILRIAGEGAKTGATVILTQHAERENETTPSMIKFWGEILRDGTPEAKIIPHLAKMKLPTVRKWTYDAFYRTELEEILHKKDIRWVVIAGVMTDVCCETTARSAFVRGFFPIILADATATLNEELHLSALRTLAHAFARISNTETILKELSTE